MEKREDALREALAENEKETERWQSYQKEYETAIENLQNFSKFLTVDVMVPVGRKALIPGQLIHTNEVLVSHYQGYFSKCSVSKATEICKLRISKAKDHLKKLETEADLWQNKLERPYGEGVLPGAGEREIIEDYDYEKEQSWREEHRKRLKQAKLKEKKERDQQISQREENANKTDDDIFKMLEEAELMEELEKELDSLQIEEINDETIRQLMAGEINSTKEKPRIAHDEVKVPSKLSEESGKLKGLVKKNDEQFVANKPLATNNNTRRNPEIVQALERSYEDGAVHEDDDIVPEVRAIKSQANFLPVADQVGFYDYQIEIVQKKISSLRMKNEEDINEKLQLLAIQDQLEDLLALAIEEVSATEDKSEGEEEIEREKSQEKESAASTQRRRISFALEDETLLFRRNEAVSQMLPNIQPKEPMTSQREVISLDDDSLSPKLHLNPDIPIDKKEKEKKIVEKVEKNLQHASESDLVTKIINEGSHEKTIYIKFTHSNQETEEGLDNPLEDLPDNFIPERPSDFYKLYLKDLKKGQGTEAKPTNIYVNAYKGEEEVKAPILREVNRQEAYEDIRIKYSKPEVKEHLFEENSTQTKSILRNKLAVEKEKHFPIAEKKKKTKVPFNEEEYMSAYNKVMNDVIEKPNVTAPEPLPEGKFIDAHAPKKRISRFKLSR